MMINKFLYYNNGINISGKYMKHFYKKIKTNNIIDNHTIMMIVNIMLV